ncbi:hypothetical protein OG937_29815 [Streptomyces sp. NBC_00510]
MKDERTQCHRRAGAGHRAADRLLCTPAAASVVVLPSRGTGEASTALPDGPSWTAREEADPAIV